ncbi:MORN repeat-containing protein 2-like [Dysidea avara]|uniref:MORN repeat-containing protein 2-like n=1 Tax=Dysidea avara TaxID=196820 RepID=UPI00332F3520
MAGKVKKSKSVASPVVMTDTLIFPNGEKYVGQYVKQSDKTERQGTGVHYASDGTEFSGIWVDDKLNGEGVIKYPDGSIYKGSLVNGEYSGKGEYTFSDGSKYLGNFTNNMMEGPSEFTDNEGRVWIGTFNGKKANGLTLKLS